MCGMGWVGLGWVWIVGHRKWLVRRTVSHCPPSAIDRFPDEYRLCQLVLQTSARNYCAWGFLLWFVRHVLLPLGCHPDEQVRAGVRRCLHEALATSRQWQQLH